MGGLVQEIALGAAICGLLFAAVWLTFKVLAPVERRAAAGKGIPRWAAALGWAVFLGTAALGTFLMSLIF